MRTMRLRGRGDFAEWRLAARRLLNDGTSPEAVTWTAEDTSDLFGCLETSGPAPTPATITVSKAFADLAESIICHSDPARFALAYRLLWRLQSERHLLEIASDTDVTRARMMAKSVHRDDHKMRAFVRFKDIGNEGPRRRFMAWFEPDHFIVARAAPFFQRRFNDMDWIIATPKGTAAWNGETLTTDDEPAAKPALSDHADTLWRTYYCHIFNPARLKVKAMQTHMPKKYWKNLPEAALIPDLIAEATARTDQMIANRNRDQVAGRRLR
ncbi:TIGR03915 family putative DNA repair protein [Asticcacaulis solisilvae]|uniref:TIGR03915 family putative DNA repair protein n=1 Tax=Asticcacaulis solisilvae TaxID=1217274 RepID=UPI003FD8894A